MRITNYTDEATLKKLKSALAQERNPLNILIELIIRTGCRQVEAVNLPIDVINTNKGAVLILAAKGSKDRLVMVNTRFARELADMFQGYDTPKDYFKNQTSDSLKRALRRRWDKVCLNTLGYDQKLSLHGLRASYGITAYNLTKDILLVKELLGHNQIANTLRYVETARIQAASHQIRTKLG